MSFMKYCYLSPYVLSCVRLNTEQDILSSSVVKNIELVETTGHEVQNVIDWSDPNNNFNDFWY